MSASEMFGWCAAVPTLVGTITFVVFACACGVLLVLALHLSLLLLDGLKLRAMPAAKGTAPAHIALRRSWLTVAVLLVLVGCGGSEDNEAPRRGVQPVDCDAQPLQCV
jgi:hypothetical protein